MNTWTRTLNLDDTHTLLALARPGMDLQRWIDACHRALHPLSQPRRAELIRLVRHDFVDDDGVRVTDAGFLATYARAPASVQLELVAARWATTHPITILAATELVGPALANGRPAIPLAAVDAFVADKVGSASPESLRKTRTVLLAALEGVGAVITRGTGQHRSIVAAHGRPHPITFAWLYAEGGHGPGDAIDDLLPVKLTRCTPEYAESCLREVVAKTA